MFSLVERGGRVRSQHVANVSAKTLRPILTAQIDAATSLMTDGAGQYRHMHKDFARHEMVNHEIDEYVRGDAHTNTIESYFAILKRGVIGTYHHVSEAHLKRYLAEFDYRYNERQSLDVDDAQRMEEREGHCRKAPHLSADLSRRPARPRISAITGQSEKGLSSKSEGPGCRPTLPSLTASWS